MSTPLEGVRTRKGKRKGPRAPEDLVLDARAGLTPSQMVDRKLTALLGYSSVPGRRLSTAPGRATAS
jgi:hypothetical protein